MQTKLNHAISRLGERFNFDAHYFTKNTFWLLVGQGMMSVAAFITTVVFANYVSKQAIGDYRLIVSLYAVLAFFTLPGMGAALMHSVVNNKDGSLAEAVQMRQRYGLFAVVAGIILAFYFGVLKQNPVFGVSVLVAAICVPIIESYSLYIVYLQGKQEYKYSSINTGLVKVISSVAVIGTIFIYPTAVYLIAVFYVSQALVTYYQYRMFLKKFPQKNKSTDEGMLPYAKHASFAGAISLFLSQADKFILYHFFGPISLAQYWIASTIPQEAGRVIWTISQVVYPKFIKGDHAEMKKWLPSKILIVTIGLIAISCLYALIAYPFFSIFFPQYINQVGMSTVLMFANVVVPYTFVWIFYSAKRNIKVAYISNIVDPILQIILFLSLIPFFGVWGLVYALLLKSVIMNIIAWFIFKFN